MWVLWLYLGGIVVVLAGIGLYYRLTPDKQSPSHSQRPPTAAERAGRSLRRRLQRKPPGKRQEARKDARRGEWAARVKRARGVIKVPSQLRKAPAGALIGPVTEEQYWTNPEPEWAGELRARIEQDAAVEPAPEPEPEPVMEPEPGPAPYADPYADLQRAWPEGPDTGTFRKDMLARMERDGQLPPEPLDHTREWLARADAAAEQQEPPPDAFMGRPEQKTDGEES